MTSLGQVVELGLSLEPDEELETIDPWHFDVRNQQSRLLNSAEEFSGVLAVLGNEHRVFQMGCGASDAHQEHVVLIVFDQEDRREFGKRSAAHDF
jgi:hypothetical protein